MDPLSTWNALIVNPLADGLRFLYSIFGNYGIAIIVFTFLVRIVMLPLSMQQLRSSKAMQELQPQVQALQKKYAKDKEKLSQEQMKLYKEAGVNPLAGCLPTVIQMPIWIGLYSALSILAATPEFQTPFLWIANLAAMPNTSDILGNLSDFILPVITVVTQFITQKMMTPTTQDPQAKSMNSMMSIMPLMFGFFCLQVPAGLVVYWVASNLFSMVQQYFTTGWGSLATLIPGNKTAPKKLSMAASSPSASAASSSEGGLSTTVWGLFSGRSANTADESEPAAPAPAAGKFSGSPKTVQMLDAVTEPVPSSEGKRKPKRGK
ncbi:MAG: YidC/Oxa1 family membrane protein insertase [Chloroflexota bacterium]|nr:YidC/Oxa1 family membrane protein insertase [Chloroflexota bacterium]